VDAGPLPFPPPSFPRLPLLLHPCFTYSVPFSSFLLPLKFSKEVHAWGSTVSFPQCPAKMAASCESWRGPNTLGPHDLQCWRGRVPRVSWGGCIRGRTLNTRRTVASSTSQLIALFNGITPTWTWPDDATLSWQ